MLLDVLLLHVNVDIITTRTKEKPLLYWNTVGTGIACLDVNRGQRKHLS